MDIRVETRLTEIVEEFLIKTEIAS